MRARDGTEAESVDGIVEVDSGLVEDSAEGALVGLQGFFSGLVADLQHDRDGIRACPAGPDCLYSSIYGLILGFVPDADVSRARSNVCPDFETKLGGEVGEEGEASWGFHDG